MFKVRTLHTKLFEREPSLNKREDSKPRSLLLQKKERALRNKKTGNSNSKPGTSSSSSRISGTTKSGFLPKKRLTLEMFGLSLGARFPFTARITTTTSEDMTDSDTALLSTATPTDQQD